MQSIVGKIATFVVLGLSPLLASCGPESDSGRSEMLETDVSSGALVKRLMPIGAANNPTGGVTQRDGWLQLERDLGVRLPIRRSYDGLKNFPPSFAQSAAGIDIGLGIRGSIYSFKVPWEEMSNGQWDKRVRDFVDSIPPGHPVWLCFGHEPDNDGSSLDATAAPTYRAAFAHFAQLVKKQRGAKPIVVTEILTGWTFEKPQNHRTPQNWVAPEAEIVAIDAYGKHCGNRSPATVFGAAATYFNTHRIPWAVAETGCESWDPTAQDQAAWIQLAFDYLYANGAEWATWWNSRCLNGPCDFRLASKRANQAFAAAVNKYSYGKGL